MEYFKSDKYSNWVCDTQMDKDIFERILNIFGEVFQTEMLNLGQVCIVVTESQQPITYPKRQLAPFDYLVFLYTTNTCQMAYQLAHEIMHIITDCNPDSANLKSWSEGLSCAASYYVLRRIKENDSSWENYYEKAKGNAVLYCDVTPTQQLAIADAIYCNRSGWHSVSYLRDWKADKSLSDIRDGFRRLCQNDEEIGFIDVVYEILTSKGESYNAN